MMFGWNHEISLFSSLKKINDFSKIFNLKNIYMYEYSKANIKNVQNIIRRNTKLQFNEFFKSFGKLIWRNAGNVWIT